MKLAEDNKNLDWQINIYADMSGTLYNGREYQNGLNAALSASKLMKTGKLKSDSLSFKIHANLAINHHRLNNFSEARKHFEQTEYLLKINPELESIIPLYVAFNYSNHGKMWIELLDYHKGLVYLEKAKLVSRRLNNDYDKAMILGNLALAQINAGNTQDGLKGLTQVINFYEKNYSPYSKELPNFLFILGQNLSSPSERAIAYNKCIFYLKRHKSEAFRNHLISWAYKELIECRLLINDTKKAIANLKEFGHEIQNPEKDDYFLLARSLVYQKEKNYRDAIQGYTNLLDRFADGKNYSEGLTSINPYKTSLAFQALKQLSEARQQLKTNNLQEQISNQKAAFEALELIILLKNEYQKKILRFESQLSFLHKYHFIHLKALYLAHKLYVLTSDQVYKKKAFLLAEQSKKSISDGIEEPLSGHRPIREDSLRNLILIAETKVNQLKLSSNTEGDTLPNLQLRIDGYLKELGEINPLYRQRKKEPDLAKSLKAIPQEVLYLNYVNADSLLFICWASNSDFGVERVRINPYTYGRAISYLKSSLTTEPDVYEGFYEKKNSTYLYRLLSSPKKFFENTSYTRLVINPSGELFDLSFDILQKPGSNSILLEDKSIAYASDIGDMHTTSETSLFKKASWNIFLPFSIGKMNRSISEQILKHGDTEINDIKGQKVISARATRNAWFKALRKNEITLLITHGGIENNDPYVMLQSEQGLPDPVYVSEIKYQRFFSALAILSACETSMGKAIDGFGMYSMGRILRLTGCKSVAGSIWQVDDLSMSVLGSNFYRFLEKGYPKDIALQKAKLAYLETSHGKQYDHPYYWAHFQIYGDVSKVTGSMNLAPYLLSALALIPVLFFIRRKKL